MNLLRSSNSHILIFIQKITTTRLSKTQCKGTQMEPTPI